MVPQIWRLERIDAFVSPYPEVRIEFREEMKSRFAKGPARLSIFDRSLFDTSPVASCEAR